MFAYNYTNKINNIKKKRMQWVPQRNNNNFKNKKNS